MREGQKGVNQLDLKLLKDCPLRSFVMLTPHASTELVVLVPLLTTHSFELNEARVIRLCLIRWMLGNIGAVQRCETRALIMIMGSNLGLVPH